MQGRKEMRPIFLIGFLVLVLLSTATAQASQENLTILNVTSIRDIRGEHSQDQSIEVLNTKTLSGDTDDWDQYIEFAPAQNKGYVGIITFKLPSDISPDDVESITLNTNYQGAVKTDQKWSWKIKNFDTRRKELLGDNQSAQDWVWTSMTFTASGSSYVSSNGRIQIRFASNNAYDVCNIDFLQLQIQTAGDTSTDDTTTTTDDTTADDTITDDTTTDETTADDTITDDTATDETTTDETTADDTITDDTATDETTTDETTADDTITDDTTADDIITDDSTIDETTTDDSTTADTDYKDISLSSSITHVQPMTGIVFWTDSGRNSTDSIQLEYAYTPYNKVVTNEDEYDWTYVDELLNEVAARGHQAILRFYYVYPGESTTVPDYIKNSTGYEETKGQSEGQTTYFPDWSNEELQSFTLEFFTKFAERYDDDARLAFLQVGFGLWGEYHIYDGPMQLGKTFPSKDYQTEFAQHLDSVFNLLPWNISIDAADTEVAPYGNSAALLALDFGLFDDSFLHETHDEYNADCFNTLNYQSRYENSPLGGELSYYSDYDQKHALDAGGPYGISFETLAAQYHISYMIGNDQPDYQSMSRIAEAGMATGYNFKITGFKASSSQSIVTVENTGIAPIYYDAFVAVDGVRSDTSLKGLLPGQSKEFTIAAGGTAPELTIQCDRLVSGQEIEFDADL